MTPGEKILLENVRWEMNEGIAYIRIANFHSQNTTQHLRKVLKKILATNPKGVVVDLRNNPGGLFKEVLASLNLFVSEGVLVRVAPRCKEKTTTHSAEGETLAPSVPMVVLVNEGTASCAEIMAGCLQDTTGPCFGNNLFWKGNGSKYSAFVARICGDFLDYSTVPNTLWKEY